jgi:hypothetical protein
MYTTFQKQIEEVIEEQVEERVEDRIQILMSSLGQRPQPAYLPPTEGPITLAAFLEYNNIVNDAGTQYMDGKGNDLTSEANVRGVDGIHATQRLSNG